MLHSTKSFFLLVTMCISVCAKAQEIIPFTLNVHNNILIDAVLNETDTVPLMFHTAAADLTLTSEATKHMTSVSWDEENEVKSWGGNSTSRVSKTNRLSIGSTNWESVRIWEDERSGPNSGGKFGPIFFEGKVLEINYDKSEMIIHDSLPTQMAGFIKTPLLFEDDYMFIEGICTIDGKAFTNRFLIHSGYGGTILFDDKFAAESQISEHVKIIDEKELKDSFGNIIKTKKGLLSNFHIGEADFQEMPVGFFEGAIGRQQMSVLGCDLLKRFNMIIDIDGRFIYLQPSQGFNAAFADT